MTENTTDRLTTKEVSAMFNIKETTIRSWRRYRRYDKRYPRYHKLIGRMVYYVKSEIIEDMANMEVEADRMEMRF